MTLELVTIGAVAQAAATRHISLWHRNSADRSPPVLQVALGIAMRSVLLTKTMLSTQHDVSADLRCMLR